MLTETGPLLVAEPIELVASKVPALTFVGPP